MVAASPLLTRQCSNFAKPFGGPARASSRAGACAGAAAAASRRPSATAATAQRRRPDVGTCGGDTAAAAVAATQQSLFRQPEDEAAPSCSTSSSRAVEAGAAAAAHSNHHHVVALSALALALGSVVAASDPCLAADAADAAASVPTSVVAAKLASDVLRPLFNVFTLLYIVRVPMTWYPEIDGTKLPWAIAYVPTEGVLSVTRKALPLVSGVDVSPIVWVGILSFLSEILLGPQGLLTLVQLRGGV